MHQTVRALLLASAAIIGGIAINILLLYLFRNKAFLQSLKRVQKFTSLLRNPMKNQHDSYQELHQAVQELKEKEEAENETNTLS